MSESKNCLVEIPLESFPTLRDKYKVDWPKHVVAFSLLDDYISNEDSKSRDFKKFYCLNGEYELDGTFVSVVREKDILFATLDPAFQRLKILLSLLDYNQPKMFFMCTREAYYAVLHEVIREKQLTVLWDEGTVMKYMRKEDAEKFDVEIPPNFELKSLSKENAFKINSVWPHREEGSVKFIEFMIEHNTNVGLFNETGELVAWCLRLSFGSLGALQVDENHLRKGYGTIVTKAISKKIAKDYNLDVTANVIGANFKSLNLFNKLGFKDIDKNYWIGVKKSETME